MWLSGLTPRAPQLSSQNRPRTLLLKKPFPCISRRFSHIDFKFGNVTSGGFRVWLSGLTPRAPQFLSQNSPHTLIPKKHFPLDFRRLCYHDIKFENATSGGFRVWLCGLTPKAAQLSSQNRPRTLIPKKPFSIRFLKISSS